MATLYHTASEIKPGRGLTTKLTRGTSLFTNASDLKCMDPTIFPVTYASKFLLAIVAVFSDLNIDDCCDDHGFLCFLYHCWIS